MNKLFAKRWYLWVSWAAVFALVAGLPVRADIFDDFFGDVEVTKTANKTTASAGDIITYTITVKNNSSTAVARNVTAIDGLPFDLDFVEGSASQPLQMNSSPVLVVVWETETLAPGSSSTLTFEAKVKPSADSPIENCTAVTALIGDLNVPNNFPDSCATVNIVPGGNPPPPPPAGPPPAPTPPPPPAPNPPPPAGNPPPPAPTPPPSPTPPPPPGGSGSTAHGSITGVVFNDVNNNGAKNEGEPMLSGWVAYLDTNDNGVFNAGEPSDTTESPYLFSNLADGTYNVRQVVEPGWSQTTPDNKYVVTISGGNAIMGKDFGNHQNPSGGGGTTSTGSGGGSSGGGGGGGSNSAPPTTGGGGGGGTPPPGQVLGDFTPGPGLQMPPPAQVLGATQLPRTGGGLPVLGFAIEFGFLTTFVLRKLKTRYL